MPVTALELPDRKSNGPNKRIKFITQDFAVNLSVDVYQCDNDWIPMGEPTQGTHTDDEEMFHRNLRSEAIKRNHFVADESTNPEWNPGYVDPDEPLNMAPDPDEFKSYDPTA